MLKQLVGRLGRAARLGGRRSLRRPFRGSTDYWVRRYRKGRNSGSGSYGRLAEFKAEILNTFVREQGIQTVIEFGCGDGNQLRLAAYPRYLGLDISHDALHHCRRLFAGDETRRFVHTDAYQGEQADLALSLDVLYHLVEDEIFEAYVRRLFAAGTRYVIIYSSNTDERLPQQGEHVRHRRFTDWVEQHIPGWKLIQHIPNRYPYQGNDHEESFADFYVYSRG